MREKKPRIVSAVVVALALGTAVSAGSAATGWRLVHRFDFEEREEGNYEEMPRYWYAIGRPADTANPNFTRYPVHERLIAAAGFGAYCKVGFDDSQQVSGKESFQLGVDGGSAGAFLEMGTLAAVPGSDYEVSAMVRTQGLRRSSVRLIAYLIDGQGQRIESSVSEVRVPPRADEGVGPWQAIAVRVLGEAPQAAWLGIELQVQQPQALAGAPREVLYQDVRGGAWFDDVCVWQVPRLVVSTQSRVNIVRWPQRPQLSMQMRHHRVQSLAATARLFDHELNLVATAERPFKDAAAAEWTWQPRIERFGWYLAELTLGPHQGRPWDEPVERALCPFLWLPETQAAVGSDFVIAAEKATTEEWRLLPDALAALSLRAVAVSCWLPSTDPQNLAQRQADLEKLLDALGGQGVQTELSLWPVPGALMQEIPSLQLEPALFLLGPKEVWRPYLLPVVMQHGQEVRRWRLGPVAASPALASEMEGVQNVLQEMVPGPTMVLPSSVYGAARTLAGPQREVSLRVPGSVVPGDLPRYLEEWPPHSVTVELQLPSARRLTHERRVQDLVLRMLYARSSAPGRIAIESPWASIGSGRDLRLVPDPLAGIFSLTAQRLAGRRFAGWLPLEPGLRAMLFDGEKGGMLAAWRETAAPSQARIQMYLGQAPVAVDVWGNRWPLPATSGGQALELGPTPIFVEGIDAQLAMFRAAFHVDPALVASMQSPQEKALVLSNPWKRTISGSLVILQPEQWGYQPQYHEFSIPAGRTQRLPVRISFPTSEIAGHKQLVAKFDFTAERHYTLTVAAPLFVGLPDLDFNAQLVVEEAADGRQDALVTQVVSNRGERVLSLYAFASIPQQPLQEKSIQQLLPGQSVVRVFRFAGAGPIVRHQPVRVGVRETSGPAGLNKLISLE